MNQNHIKQIVYKYGRLLLIGVGLALFLLLAASLVQPTTPAYAGLPPRPTGVPNPNDTVTINGAQIKLVVAEAVGNEWTAVQWQDPNTGEWTTVDGWQGSVEADGTQIWWVGTDQFDRGPFRWQVFDEEGGTLLDTSESFTMPSRNREIVTVNIPTVEE